MGEGQTGEPAVASRVDAEARRGGGRRSGDGVMGEHHALRNPGRPRGRDDEGVTLLDGSPPGKRVLPGAVDQQVGCEGLQEASARRGREAGIEGEDGVSPVVGTAEGGDEGLTSRQVKGDEPTHGGSVSAAMVSDGSAAVSWEAAGSYGDISYEFAEGIAKITICRPEVRNAFRPQTLFELSEAFERARDDPAVGVVILTGQGPDAFCSGGDQMIRGEDGYLGDDDVAQAGIGRLNVLDLQIQIRRLPKPVVAMVAGYAIGGGHVLHLVCDLTIAADNARFGQTGPRVGSFDGGYGAGLLARTIGAKRAKEIWFLCRQYDAERAFEMGLVNAVVPLADLEAETVSWCREMLALSPIALRMLKAGFNAAEDGLAGVQQLAGDATMLFYMTEEAREGRDAYLEKRPPDFSRFPRRP